jgi:hypothetical protein
VPLEKQADMLIADHMRKKDAPHGSYSWMFIQDSVKNGYRQLEDKYLIGSHPDEPKRVGSSHPTKSTRTPFTKEDDARLARWALQHPTEQRGNKIWQEYEQIVSFVAISMESRLTSARMADILHSHGAIATSRSCNNLTGAY